MKKYKLIVWCPDCSGDQDDQGCFGGGTEEQNFISLERAIKQGEKSIRDSIWEYKIVGATKTQFNKAYKKLYGFNYY